MSRFRASWWGAISTRTCPCPVRRVQAPPFSPGSLITRDHILTRGLSRVYTHEIFLAFLLTCVAVVPMLMVRSGRRSGSWEVMQMREVSFPVELVRGVPVVAAPEEIDITNAAGLRAALLTAGGSEAGGHGTVVVDMTRTRFCDSAGISALVGAHKRAQAEGGRVLLAVSGTAVPRIFELTGIDRIIPSFTSLEEALAETLAGTGPVALADLAEHAAVDGDQGRLLFLAEALVGADRILGRRGRLRARARFGDAACRVGRDLVDEAGLGHQRLRGNVERVGDLLEHAHRGLVQAALDLAEVP